MQALSQGIDVAFLSKAVETFAVVGKRPRGGAFCADFCSKMSRHGPCTYAS